jgi:hypothetical protein
MMEAIARGVEAAFLFRGTHLSGRLERLPRPSTRRRATSLCKDDAISWRGLSKTVRSTEKTG